MTAHKMGYMSLKLCLACVVMFILQLFLGTGLFALDASVAWQQPWRLLTAVFAHGSAAHLLSNLFALALFGLILEARIGAKKVFWTFIISGILVNAFIVHFNFYSVSLGASGAIFAILGTLAMLRPLMVVWVYGMPMPMFIAGMLWAVQDILGVFSPGTTANIAHLAGLAIGLILGVVWRREYGDRARKREKMRKRDGLDAELDEWEKKHMKNH